MACVTLTPTCVDVIHLTTTTFKPFAKLPKGKVVNHNRIHYPQLFNLIQLRTGLTLDPNKQKEIVAVIDTLLSTEIVNNPDELMQLLSSQSTNHPCWQPIISNLTIGETYFFRNSPQFDALRTKILPTLIEAKRVSNSKQLRIWSAGCATGEEPYSIAILLRELLPDIDAWNITLMATDINDNYLQAARRGIYRTRSFRSETPDEINTRWFQPVSDSSFQLKSIIRNMVVFRPLNLIADHFPSFESGTMYLDLILCRNVTIYFDRETTRQVVQKFYQSLINGGWLVVGHSEPQQDLYNSFSVHNFRNAIFYRKEHTAKSDPEIHIPISTWYQSQPLNHDKHVDKRPEPQFITHANTNNPVEQAEDHWVKAKQAADSEKWDEAKAWLDKTKGSGRLKPQVYYLRALVEIANDNITDGLQFLRQAVYCDPNFVLARYMLGDLFHSQGKVKEAIRQWQWAHVTLDRMDSQTILPFSDDLTVEMLQELLAHRLSKK